MLHLVNSLKDSSIIRIVQRIVSGSDSDSFSWQIGSLHGLDDESGIFNNTGIPLLDYSVDSPWEKLQRDLIEKNILILHSHTPRTIITGWRAIRRNSTRIHPRHVATKHLLNKVHDRRWGLIYTFIDYLGLYLPDILIPVSYTMGQKIKRLPGITSQKVIPIPNGINLQAYDIPLEQGAIRNELGIPLNAFVFGFAGRLDPVKRIDIFILSLKQVLDQVPSAHLLILGEGHLRSQLQEQSIGLKVDHSITWGGFRDDMPRMMASMDVYVQPSDNEGLSLSILEAMAARKPVIATSVGAAREVITHGNTGWLIPPGSVDLLADAMLQSIRSVNTFSSMANNAYINVTNHYSLEAMVNSYYRVYQTQVSGG